MRLHLAAILLLIGCKGDRLVPARDVRCGTPCYVGNQFQAGKGVCNYGVWECEDVGVDPICVGAGKPDAPVCDGLDHNCDGKLDGDARTCSTACGSGAQTCSGGVWSECTAKKPEEEICNNKDDNCDGIVDNGDLLPVTPCYGGPAGTLSAPFGDCHPGVMMCESGALVCRKEKRPTEEICGDNIDNDCDWIVDNTSTVKPRDILVILDNSGSMTATIDSVKAATQAWAVKYQSREDLRWALAVAPGTESSEDGQVLLKQNFTDAVTFNQIMSQQRASPTSMEATLDAIYQASVSSNPLRLSRRGGVDMTIILFTDETAQSYLSPRVTAQMAADEARRAGVKVYLFISVGDFTFQPIASQTGGREINIMQSANTIQSELDVLVNNCQ